jgi:hypothetical protein
VSSRIQVRLVSLALVMLLATLLFGLVASPTLAKSTKHRKHHAATKVHRTSKHKKRKKKRSQASWSKSVIRAVAKQYKLGKADTNALIKLAYRESSWNPRCITGSYRGLFQIRTRSHGWSNPWWNTARAIRDIKRVYHTPRRALAHSYSHGWY